MNTKPLNVFVSFPTAPFTDRLPNGDGLVAYHFVHTLLSRGHRVHVATPRADLSEHQHSGLVVHQMGATQPRSSGSSVRYMCWVRSVLRQVMKVEEIDLIHELNPVFAGLSLAFVGSGIPVVLGPHSSRWSVIKPANRRQQLSAQVQSAIKEGLLFIQHRLAKAILLSTPAALNNVTCPERISERLFLIPPGIDEHRFVPDRERPPATSQMVLFLANVSQRKGIYCLLKAFESVWREIPIAKLHVAGDGPELDAVKELVARSQFRENITFIGRIAREDIPRILQKACIYCLPSFGEPFGMTALEAMACGLPLVVTQTGGLGYLVTPEGGRLVREGDAGELAAALIELLKSPRLRVAMGQHNRLVVERSYTWAVVGRHLEEVYLGVLRRTSMANDLSVRKSIIRDHRERLKTNQWTEVK